MRSDTLGDIKRENGDADGVAHIRYHDSTVELSIIPDDATFDEALELAESFAKRLDDFDDAAKIIAAAALTGTYNNGWNEYDVVQADGSLQSVSNLELSEAEFAKKLTLVGVNIYGSGLLSLFYDNDGMFWGHSVVVTSMNGLAFTDTTADFVG